MSAFRSSVSSSALVENVLSGTVTAPMRAAASQPTTKSRSVRVQQADVRALARADREQPAASAAERCSASA